MNRIFLTGDTHGGIDATKLHDARLEKLCKDDYIIVLGDFGYIFYANPDNAAEQYKLEWFKKQPYTTLFIDGNHENHHRLNQYPISIWNGGKVHKINDSVIHLMRGQCFTIGDKTFFTFGGADSIDKHLRRINFDWWIEEVPSYAEMDEGIENANKIQHVDYILTHTAPNKIVHEMFNYHNDDPTEKMLNWYYDNLPFEHWYFGHFHEDKSYDKFTCLYNKLIEI